MESFRIIEKNGVILFCNASNLLIQMGKEEEKKIYIYIEPWGVEREAETKKKKKRKKKEKKMEKENKGRRCIFFPI